VKVAALVVCATTAEVRIWPGSALDMILAAVLTARPETSSPRRVDLPEVDADAHLEVFIVQLRAYGSGGVDRGRRGGQESEDTVAGGLDDLTAAALDGGAVDLVVAVEEPLPRRVASGLGSTG
jgi:hypothetical protein